MNEQNELPVLNKTSGQIESNQKGKRKLFWSSNIITAVLLIFALFSVAQTVQSTEILNKIEQGGVSSASSSSSGAVLPDNLNNLPNMVGGC